MRGGGGGQSGQTHFQTPYVAHEGRGRWVERRLSKDTTAAKTAQTGRTGAREPSKQWVPGTLNSFMVESTVAAAAAMAAARVTIVRCETICGTRCGLDGDARGEASQ